MDNEQKILDFIETWKSTLLKSDLQQCVDILESAIEENEKSDLKNRQDIRHTAIAKALDDPKQELIQKTGRVKDLLIEQDT